MLNKFYDEPNFIIGKALFESGDESFGQIMLNLLSRGLKSDAVKFLTHFRQEVQALVDEDNITDESEWGLIIELLPSIEDKSLILLSLSIKGALVELHQNEKDQFDFYNWFSILFYTKYLFFYIFENFILLDMKWIISDADIPSFVKVNLDFERLWRHKSIFWWKMTS